MQAAVATLAVVLFLPTASLAWRVIPVDARSAGPVAIDADRDVFAVIGMRPSRQAITTGIVKLAHADGAELWRRPLRARGDERSDELYDLKVTANGDVVTAGSLDDNGHMAFFVGRLAGADGRVRWRRIIHGRKPPSLTSNESASAIALDAAGDVIAVGGIEGTTTAQYRFTNDLAVVKFDGQTGRERWRFLLNGTADDGDGANAVAVDGMGDVIVLGGTREGQWPSAYPVSVVLKLARDDGRLLWRRDEGPLTLAAVAVDGRGDVLVASGSNPFAEGSFDAIKLSGATGERVWAGALARGADEGHYLTHLRVLPSDDDIVTGGYLYNVVDATNSWIEARLDGATGAEIWRRVLRGSAGEAWGRALAIAKNGDVVAGGTMRNVRSCYDATVVRLDAAAGDVLHRRSIDGTSMASDCERPDCGASRIPCGPTRKGIDQDRLNALAIHESGRIAIAGVVCNGPRGRERGFVAAFPNAPYRAVRSSSSSSIRRGQSSLSSRDSDRSARTTPSVWQRGQ